MSKIKKIISKKNKTKIVSLSAYSKNVASILDNYCDIILVGDSLGSVLYNYKSTREATLNAMIEHKSQKLEYFHKFTNKYKTLESLSKINENQILKLWETQLYLLKSLQNRLNR